MKKLHFSLIATACALALTACSSSKDSSNITSPISVGSTVATATTPNNTTATNTEQSQSQTPTTPAAPTQPRNTTTAPTTNTTTNTHSNTGSASNTTTPPTTVTPPPTTTPTPPAETEEEKAARLAKAEKERLDAIKTQIQSAFVDNGANDNNITKMSGITLTTNDSGKLTAKNIDPSKNNDLNKLYIDDNTTLTLYNDAEIATAQGYSAITPTIKDLNETVNGKTYSGKVGSLPSRKATDDFNQVKYGVYTVDGINTLFVQGHYTPTTATNYSSPYNHFSYPKDALQKLRPMPTTGSFKYNGYALYGKDSYETLTASAIADMDSKKVKVELKESSATEAKVTFGGIIDGNTFEGIYNGVQAKGAFYGTKAWDIGGTFYHIEGDNKDYNGVFGASQGTSFSGNPTTEKLDDFAVTK